MVRRGNENVTRIVIARGSGTITLLGVAAVVAATLYVVHFGLTLHPFATNVHKTSDLRPTVLHAIQSADQLVTADRQVDQEITKSASSRLPGSTESLTYMAVYDVKAGVDLSQIKESDITIDGDTVRITLPPSYIVSQALDAQKSHVVSRSTGPTSFIGGASKDLLDTVLREAEKRANTETLADGTLLKAAQENAASDLTRLLNNAGIKNVAFVSTPSATPPSRFGPTPVTPTPTSGR
ncbi:MAG: DUF4230 domain-containing protein [Thermomicrobiales bacterium]